MIKDDSKKEANLKKALSDFEIANKYIQETLKNLQDSQEKLNTSRQNFKNAMSSKLDQKLRAYSEKEKKYEYNMSIEEKTLELHAHFLTAIIRDESNKETIIFGTRK